MSFSKIKFSRCDEIGGVLAEARDMISIASTKDDDERFLELASRIACTTIRDLRPADVFVTRIDHWFDHKWLGFSGKVLGAVAVHRQERLTIPPFIPRRVISQQSYRFDADAAAYRVASLPPLHRHQQSSDNLRRFIDTVSQSAVFIWFSGGTVEADQGSLMIYNVEAEGQGGWYASFRRTDTWHLQKVRGISIPELMSLIERGVDVTAIGSST